MLSQTAFLPRNAFSCELGPWIRQPPFKVDIDDARFVNIDMTLTAPGCPVAGDMPGWVENAVGVVPGVSGVKVQLVFDPPWDQSRMSDEAKVAMNMW